MNKYLLLRDNKQSGPYSTDELIAKGIKAYDLVWLEGKSAAWRYPSEVEELKAFSPAVEEQPFDRFYKKPEPQIQEDHSRYEPKAVQQPVVKEEASKKVYVNFPATPEKTVEPKPVVVQEKKAQQPVFTEPLITEEPRHIALPPRYDRPEKTKNYFVYGAVAAGLLMISLITFLVINHNRQQQNIAALNALVQQISQNTKNQKAMVIPAATVQDVAESPAADMAPEDINHAQIITDEKPVTPVVKPGNSSVEKPRSGISEKENIIFKEAKASPAPAVEEPAVKPDTESDNSVPHENLFKLVTVKSNDYKTGVLGGISDLQLELTNNSLHELHRVAVEIKYLGPEKKVVRTQTVYFENVAPGAQTTLDVPKSNRGVSIDYTITSIKS